MGPKRKDRETDQSSSKTSNGRGDPIQADHELFLQAFESKLISFSSDLEHKIISSLLFIYSCS